ncbi:hypothetical protein D3C80_1572840 [compost metagenome]
MLTFLKTKLMALSGSAVAILLVLAISLGMLYTKQIEKTANVAKDLSALQKDFKDLKQSIETDKAERLKLDKKIAASGQTFNDTKRSVEKFTGREAVLRAKPTLTEKMINKSFSAFTDEISCTTGDSTPCLRKP